MNTHTEMAGQGCCVVIFSDQLFTCFDTTKHENGCFAFMEIFYLIALHLWKYFTLFVNAKNVEKNDCI